MKAAGSCSYLHNKGKLFILLGAVNMEVNSPRVGDTLLGLEPGQLRTCPRLRATFSLVQAAFAFFQKKPIRRRVFSETDLSFVILACASEGWAASAAIWNHSQIRPPSLILILALFGVKLVQLQQHCRSESLPNAALVANLP